MRPTKPKVEPRTNLYKLLVEKDITQRAFAKTIGTHEANVSYWISGRHTPEGAMIMKASKALNISLEEAYALFDIK